jgi:glycogen synthase
VGQFTVTFFVVGYTGACVSFIQPNSGDNFFNRGTYYGCKDDNMRFAFFSKAALEFLLRSNKRPDIIHCHDWQTGLIPPLLFEIYKYHGMGNQAFSTPSITLNTKDLVVRKFSGQQD